MNSDSIEAQPRSIILVTNLLFSLAFVKLLNLIVSPKSL